MQIRLAGKADRDLWLRMDPHATAEGFFRKVAAGSGYVLWQEKMKEQGYPMVLLSTQVDENAQHFYRKLGYEDCGGLLLGHTPLEQPMELFLRKVL